MHIIFISSLLTVSLLHVDVGEKISSSPPKITSHIFGAMPPPIEVTCPLNAAAFLLRLNYIKEKERPPRVVLFFRAPDRSHRVHTQIQRKPRCRVVRHHLCRAASDCASSMKSVEVSWVVWVGCLCSNRVSPFTWSRRTDWLGATFCSRHFEWLLCTRLA